MASPSVTGTAAVSDTPAINVTTLSVTMPGSIAAGEGIFVAVGWDGTGTLTVDTGASSSGWQKLGQTTSGTSTHACFWQPNAVGGGSDSLTLTNSVSERGTAIALRVTGQSTSITPDYGGQGGAAAANAANGPNVNGTGGSKDYLAISSFVPDSNTIVATAAPSGYSGLETNPGPGSSNSVSLAHKQFTGSSEDPGVFTHASVAWIASTVLIHPAAASTTPITIGPVALTMTPTVTRNVNRTVSLALTFAPTLSRVINRRISPTLTLAASISRVIDRKLSLGLTLSPSVTRVVNRTVGVVLTLAASVSFVRALSMVINVAFALNASVSRVVQRNVSAPLTLVPTLSRVVNRSISAALTLVPTVSRVISRSIPVALTLVPNVVRVVERRINAALDLAASVIADFVPGGGTIFPINIEVPLNFAVSVTLGWAGGVAGAARRARTFFFGRRGIY